MLFRSLLLGVPDGVTAAGFWWKRMRAVDWRFVPPVEAGDFSTQDGVVLVSRSKKMLEKLLLTLHTTRREWPGPLAVYHWGDEDPSLTIACGRMGVKLWNVGEVPEGEEAESWLADVAAVQPFRRALILQPGMLAVGSLEGAFAVNQATPNEKEVPPLLAIRDKAQSQVTAVAAVRAEDYQGSAGEPAVLMCGDDPAQWTEAAWEAWSVAEAELAQAMSVGVRVAADATVVALVDVETVGDFQRNWLTWKFPAGTPVLVVLMGIAAEELWLPEVTRDVRVVSLSAKQANDLPWLLGWIAGECRTSRVIFLPADAAAMPGAELWVGDEQGGEPLVLHRTREKEREMEISGNLFVPVSLGALVGREWLAKQAKGNEARGRTLHDLALVMEECAVVSGAEATRTDLSVKGWRGMGRHLYVPSSPRVLRAADTRVAVLRGTDGKLRLAEDVVVISLPERTDRQKRFGGWMRRHRVRFRFVDGVRVKDEDIDPREIAEVTKDHFKIEGGWDAYLRGTVGCRRAYLRCLEEAYAAGVKSLLIMEDDAHLVDDWLERYAAAIREVPRGWLQLYLSAWDFQSSQQVSANLHRLAGAYQTTAILYSEAGIEAAVKAARCSRCDIDEWLAKHLHPYGNSYVIRPEITYQDGGVSDIRSVDRGLTP